MNETLAPAAPVLELPHATRDGAARAAAMSNVQAGVSNPTSLVSFTSRGSLLITGPNTLCLKAAAHLGDRLECTVVVNDAEPAEVQGVDVFHARLATLTGHLGKFTATVETPRGEVSLHQVLGRPHPAFDLALDFNDPQLIRREVPPPGYYAPGKGPRALRKVLDELPEMIGEFEKPKYFNYNPDICAHGASGLTGCTRCLEACPTGAIHSLKNLIEVDPYLCQGAGSCATVCPTGAITYAYPSAADLLAVIRNALKTYREARGTQACVLFHDAEAGGEQLARIAARIPERVIPFQVEELGSVGLDVWLPAIAYGAAHVALLATGATPPLVLEAINRQIAYGAAILEGMGHAAERLALLPAGDDAAIPAALGALTPQPEIEPTGFMALNEKRNTIRLALDHLHAHAPAPRELATLPEGAPFGEIRVDKNACTLCMACTSVCPSSAVMAGNELPQLRFIEWNCVQCGLCETACPEDAITLNPRMVYDPELRNQTRILNEEEPFCCIGCGKPFATKNMMNRMAEKLKDHWMYQDEGMRRRMQMCDDCRIRDLYAGEGLVDVHKH